MQLMREKKLFYRLMMLSHNILKLLRQQKKQSDKLIVFNRFLIYHSQDIHSDPGVDREQLFWQPLTIAQEKVISFWTCNISIFPQHCSSTQSGVLIHKYKWPPRQYQYILETAVLISLKWNKSFPRNHLLEEEKVEVYGDSHRQSFQPEKEIFPCRKVYNWHMTLQRDLELRQ